MSFYNGDMKIDHKKIERLVRKEFVYNVVFGSIVTISDIKMYIDLLNIVHLPSIVLVIQVDNALKRHNIDEMIKIRNDFYIKLYKHLKHHDNPIIEIVGKNNVSIAPIKDSEIAVLLPIFMEEDEKDVYIAARRYAEYMKAFVERGNEMTVSIGIGCNYKNIRDLSNSYKQAYEALKYKFYSSNSSIITYTSINKEYSDNSLLLFLKYEKRIIGYIRKNQYKRVLKCINSLFKKLEKKNKVSPYIIKMRVLELLTVIGRLAIDFGNESSDIIKLKIQAERDIRQVMLLNDTKNFLTFNIKNIMQKIKNLQEDTVVRSVNKAKLYINENYDKKLTLNEVARHVNVSSHYLSHIFKEVTKKSFKSYVIETKINNAQRLLLNTDLTIYQISYKVGYNDPNYFSRIFKKVVGESPVDYRKGVEKHKSDINSK